MPPRPPGAGPLPHPATSDFLAATSSTSNRAECLAPAPIPLAQGLLIGQNRLRQVLAEGFGIEGEDVFHTHLGYFLSVIRPYRAAFGIVGRLKRRAEILCHVILSAVPDTLSEVETGRGVHGGDYATP